jgi:hypothetical protein
MTNPYCDHEDLFATDQYEFNGGLSAFFELVDILEELPGFVDRSYSEQIFSFEVGSEFLQSVPERFRTHIVKY